MTSDNSEAALIIFLVINLGHGLEKLWSPKSEGVPGAPICLMLLVLSTCPLRQRALTLHWGRNIRINIDIQNPESID